MLTTKEFGSSWLRSEGRRSRSWDSYSGRGGGCRGWRVGALVYQSVACTHSHLQVDDSKSFCGGSQYSLWACRSTRHGWSPTLVSLYLQIAICFRECTFPLTPLEQAQLGTAMFHSRGHHATASCEGEVGMESSYSRNAAESSMLESNNIW